MEKIDHWALAFGVTSKRATSKNQRTIRKASDFKACTGSDGVPEREAAKFRVEVRRLINIGIIETDEICDILRQCDIYPHDPFEGYMATEVFAASCISPVLKYQERSGTATAKTLDMLEKGYARVKIAQVLGVHPHYVSALICQLRKRKTNSLDYTGIGCGHAGRKKKNG